MRFVEYFDNQDTAFEFDRVLRNLARYQIVRQRITGASRKRLASGAFAVSYEIGQRASKKYGITLVHKGNGVVDIRVFIRADLETIIETDSYTDNFPQANRLRAGICNLAYHVERLSPFGKETDEECQARLSQRTVFSETRELSRLNGVKWESIPFDFCSIV